MAEREPQGVGTVSEYYDRLAPVYGEGEYSQARRAAVLGTIAKEIAAAHAVLDLGCGNGTYAVEFAVRPSVNDLTLEFTETLLLAHQPVAAASP